MLIFRLHKSARNASV